jgi:hypothetical protein
MRLSVLMMTAGAAALTAGCATVPSTPAGMEAGKFVQFECSGQSFQARFNPDGNTVRVRSHSGAAELSAQSDGYADEGYMLALKGPDGITLTHAGKVLGKNCKRA